MVFVIASLHAFPQPPTRDVTGGGNGFLTTPNHFKDVPVLAGFSGVLLGNDLNGKYNANISCQPSGDYDGLVIFRDERLQPVSSPIPFTTRLPSRLPSPPSAPTALNASSSDSASPPSASSSSDSLDENTKQHIDCNTCAGT